MPTSTVTESTYNPTSSITAYEGFLHGHASNIFPFLSAHHSDGGEMDSQCHFDLHFSGA